MLIISLRNPRLISLGVALLVLASLIASAPAADLTSNDLYQQTLRSTAMVVVPVGDKAAQGTGWLVDRDRKLLVTNCHVVAGKKEVVVVFPVYRNGQVIAERSYYLKEAPRFRGQVIEVSKGHDLAVIQLDALPPNVQPLKLAAERPKAKETVLLVGNPGSSPTLWVQTSGTVQAVSRDRIKVKFVEQEVEARVEVMETKIPIKPGTSGGPVVAKNGEVIAVASGVDNKTHVIGIDVSEVREILAEVYSHEGLRHHNLGRFDLAVADYSAAISLNPANAYAFHGRGMSNKRLEKYREAIADCTQALQLDPKNARIYNERGAAHSFLDEYDQAIRDYSSAIRLNPDFALAYRNRGSCHGHKGQWEDAISDYDTAIRLNSRDAKAFLKRSEAYAKLGDRSRSKEDYEEAIQLEPSLAR
jgi:tetratricopeptide (TPR) repeat protein